MRRTAQPLFQGQMTLRVLLYLFLMKILPFASFKLQLSLKVYSGSRLFSSIATETRNSTQGKGRTKKFNSFPFQYHEEVVLKITNITNLGSGVGRKELADGSQWVVHVPYTIPDEEVRARVFRNHASYSEADLVEVIQSSPTRVQSSCKYYTQCGGCQYQVRMLKM